MPPDAATATVPEIAFVTSYSLADVEAILDAHHFGRTIALALSGIAKLERAALKMLDQWSAMDMKPRTRGSLRRALVNQAGGDAFFPLGERDAFLDDRGGCTYGGGVCPSYLSTMRSYFTPC